MTDQQVELVSITPQGLLLAVAGEQLCLPFSDFHWFAQATITQICQVSQPRPGWLRWEALDVDLSLESIRAPGKFPLVSRLAPAANQAHENAPPVQLLDPVALLVETQGTAFSGGPEPVPLSPGLIGVVVELLDGTTVLVEFADLEGATFATAFVDRGQLLLLHHGDHGVPSAARRDGVASLAMANGELKRSDADNPLPLLLEKLRADPTYAVEMFEEFWKLHQKKEPDSRQLRLYFLKVLRLAKPDLSAVITDDLKGEGWKRSLLARMIMDPCQAKQASLKRLMGRLVEIQRRSFD